MIKVKGLSKVYTIYKKEPGLLGSIKSLFKRETVEKHALKNITLNVADGEIIGLIGENGAGKTTLTKILSGIIHPTQGVVEVEGFNPWDRDNRYRSRMSLIMGQKSQLWWDLPAMDGFLLLKEIYQISDEQFNENIDYLSECLMIKDQLNVQVRRLSLGERMKVELMAALLHNPKVVFLDEPTIGLDLMAQKAVRKFIKEYRKKYNPIMILTSHYMDDIEELCERVLILKDGQFIYDGLLSDIKKKYATDKLITATVKVQKSNVSIPDDLGQVHWVNESQISIRAPRNEVMKTAAYLMENLTVEDLSIHETEISEVVEHIMTNGQVK